jgi:ribonuclease HI
VPDSAHSGGRPRSFTINVDGASRGNPGHSAAGWVIRDADGQVLIEEGAYLGEETNNRAEYLALLFALEDAMLLSAEHVTVRSDSELLVKQMTGAYRVKNKVLKGFFERAKRLAGGFKSFHIEHVPREENRDADRAANEAIDSLDAG